MNIAIAVLAFCDMGSCMHCHRRINRVLHKASATGNVKHFRQSLLSLPIPDNCILFRQRVSDQCQPFQQDARHTQSQKKGAFPVRKDIQRQVLHMCPSVLKCSQSAVCSTRFLLPRHLHKIISMLAFAQFAPDPFVFVTGRIM